MVFFCSDRTSGCGDRKVLTGNTDDAGIGLGNTTQAADGDIAFYGRNLSYVQILVDRVQKILFLAAFQINISDFVCCIGLSNRGNGQLAICRGLAYTDWQFFRNHRIELTISRLLPGHIGGIGFRQCFQVFYLHLVSVVAIGVFYTIIDKDFFGRITIEANAVGYGDGDILSYYVGVFGRCFLQIVRGLINYAILNGIQQFILIPNFVVSQILFMIEFCFGSNHAFIAIINKPQGFPTSHQVVSIATVICIIRECIDDTAMSNVEVHVPFFGENMTDTHISGDLFQRNIAFGGGIDGRTQGIQAHRLLSCIDFQGICFRLSIDGAVFTGEVNAIGYNGTVFFLRNRTFCACGLDGHMTGDARIVFEIGIVRHGANISKNYIAFGCALSVDGEVNGILFQGIQTSGIMDSTDIDSISSNDLDILHIFSSC